ncbi:MAG TPA: outer membrane protein assembly factor BamA [Longimicrobiales bacterium]
MSCEESTRAVAAAAALLSAAAVLAVPARAQEAPVAPPVVVVDSVLVQGNARLQTAVVLGEFGIHPGDTITYRDVNRGIRRLWTSGQFDDAVVRVVADSANPGAPVTLVLEVVERPYIAAIEFDGLEHLSASTVKDTADLDDGAPLRRANVAEAEVLIRQLLANKGFRVRSVEHRLEEIEGRAGQYRLVFDVTEGQRVAIAEIVFEGNEAFSDGDLRDVLGTSTEGFFWFNKGTYDEAELRKDIRERLPTFYARHGYIDFAVTGDSLVVDAESGKARLIIGVDEGPQYQLAGFSVRGNSRFPTETLEQYFERPTGGLLARFGLGGSEVRQRGEVFDRVAFEEATTQVSQLYWDNGYLGARVEPVIERTQTPDGEPAVRVGWDIVEGQVAYINRVAIEGNTRTHEDVIRERIYLYPGDVFSQELLIQSYQQIMGLGYFEAPLPYPEIERTETGDVNVTFKVKEKQTGTFQFGTSLGGWGGLAGFIGFDEPNLFGQGKSGHIRWEYGRYSNNFEASYGDPAIAGSRVSGSISLFNARDRFSPLVSEGQRRRTGAGLRFGVPFPLDPRFTRIFLGYTLSRTSYEQNDGVDSSIFGLPPGVLSSVSLGITRQTLNSPLFPTRGSRQEIEATFNGGPLGGDGDFQKYTASGSWWVPVGQVGGQRPGSRPIRFALGLSAEAGLLVGDASRFPFERFLLGGVQFGTPLRGYEESTITPEGYFEQGRGVSSAARFGNAYLRMSAEYAMRLNDNISLSLFYDAGNLWHGFDSIDPTRLFRGAGVGVTVVTPFAPLGLDFAYGFDKDDPGWQLHFKFGQFF